MNSEYNGRRLHTLVCHILTVALTLVCMACVFSFAVTRTHMYHTAYYTRVREHTNNHWLVEQCKSAEFYSNMKQHSNICEEVVGLDGDSLWLHALRDVIDKTSFCGTYTCEVMMHHIVFWVATNSIYMSMICVVCVLSVVLLIIPLQRRFMSNQQLMPRDSELAMHAQVVCSPFNSMSGMQRRHTNRLVLH